MIKKITIIILSIAALLLTTVTLAQGQLKTQVSPTQSYMGEPVTMVITLDNPGNQTIKSPNLRLLENNFTIISAGQGSQYNSVDGKSSESMQWVIGLMPKHVGKITIPALSIAGLKTDSVDIHVQSARDMPKNHNQVWVETVSSPGHATAITTNESSHYRVGKTEHTQVRNMPRKVNVLTTTRHTAAEPTASQTGGNRWLWAAVIIMALLWLGTIGYLWRNARNNKEKQ